MAGIRFGWLADPPSDHDWLATERLTLAAPTALPPSVPRMPSLGEPLNQGTLGSCVAQAVSKLLFASHARQGVKPRLASRLGIYYLARATHGSQDFDGGTYLRAAFQVLNKFGFCPEAVWPYKVAFFAAMPPASAFQASFDQRKPTAYYRIHETGNARVVAVKQALAAGYPVGFGTNVDWDFANGPSASSIIRPPVGNLAGGHAMVVGGYDAESFHILNSWGADWCDHGWCRMHPDYIAWDETRDLWVAEHAPPYSDEVPR